MCSVGSGLQCPCQHPRLMGDSNTCADGIICTCIYMDVHWACVK